MEYKRPRRTRAKLTPEIIAEIRRRLAEGEYQHDIAADLGVIPTNKPIDFGTMPPARLR